MIGFYELLVLMVLFVVPCILIVLGVWFVIRRSKRARPAADRLAELESLRRDGRISPHEYEKQRATIVVSV